jgi:hypothetical protein
VWHVPTTPQSLSTNKERLKTAEMTAFLKLSHCMTTKGGQETETPKIRSKTLLRTEEPEDHPRMRASRKFLMRTHPGGPPALEHQQQGEPLSRVSHTSLELSGQSTKPRKQRTVRARQNKTVALWKR